MHTATTGLFQLRPAATTDTDAIVDVWFTGWREAHLGLVPDALLAHRSEETFRERIPEILDTTTVATVDHRVVGLVVTAYDEIEQLYVAPGHRGTGIAPALLRHGETAIADGHRRAFLAVVDSNTRARHFYERHGWHDAGPFDYHTWAAVRRSGRRARPHHRHALGGGELGIAVEADSSRSVMAAQPRPIRSG